MDFVVALITSVLVLFSFIICITDKMMNAEDSELNSSTRYRNTAELEEEIRNRE